MKITKAGRIYRTIDASKFYKGTAVREYRSDMNVTFRLPTEALEEEFATAAAKQNLKKLFFEHPALEDPERTIVWDALRAAKLEERHQLVEADGRPALAELERRGVEVSSMGRTAADDPAFFLSAGAAGVMAGRMAAGSRRYRHLDR